MEFIKSYIIKLDSTNYPRRPHHPRVMRRYDDVLAKAEAQIQAQSEPYAPSPYSQSERSWWNPFSWISPRLPVVPQIQVPRPAGHHHPNHTPQHHQQGPKGSKNVTLEGGKGSKDGTRTMAKSHDNPSGEYTSSHQDIIISYRIVYPQSLTSTHSYENREKWRHWGC
jgi:hypothetical protein